METALVTTNDVTTSTGPSDVDRRMAQDIGWTAVALVGALALALVVALLLVVGWNTLYVAIPVALVIGTWFLLERTTWNNEPRFWDDVEARRADSLWFGGPLY